MEFKENKLVGGGGNSLKPSHNQDFSLIEAFDNLALWGENKFVSELKRTYKFQRGANNILDCHANQTRILSKEYSFVAGATHVALCDSVGSYFRHWCAAFTLAEVLITLGIIGVVVAMTMPTLIQNYKNRVVETRLQKFYSVMNQAVQKAELEYGDKKFWYEDVGGLKTDADGNPIEGSSKTDDWFQKYLAPHLQIIKKEVSSDGIPTYYFPDGSALAASQAGESRDWVFYVGKPEKCRTKHNNDPGICAFTFEFYPASQSNSWKYLYDKGFEPVKYNWNGTKENLYAGNAWACDKTGNTIDSRAYCAALIQYNGWKIPKDYPVRVDY